MLVLACSRHPGPSEGVNAASPKTPSLVSTLLLARCNLITMPPRSTALSLTSWLPRLGRVPNYALVTYSMPYVLHNCHHIFIMSPPVPPLTSLPPIPTSPSPDVVGVGVKKMSRFSRQFMTFPGLLHFLPLKLPLEVGPWWWGFKFV